MSSEANQRCQLDRPLYFFLLCGEGNANIDKGEIERLITGGEIDIENSVSMHVVTLLVTFNCIASYTLIKFFSFGLLLMFSILWFSAGAATPASLSLLPFLSLS